MDIKAYIESGVLELYVLGQLNADEAREVERMQAEHTEVAQEIYAIAQAMEEYSKLQSVQPPPHVRDEILKNLSPKSPQPLSIPSQNKTNQWLSTALAASLLLSLITLAFLYSKGITYQKEIASMKDKIYICDSISNAKSVEMALLESMRSPDNRIIPIAPTPAYPKSAIYLHHNPVTRKNVIQISDAPSLVDGQVFQLWALPPQGDPVPMEIFDDGASLASVGYSKDATTYAITIEEAGGSKVPTLSRLIGTVSVE